MGAIVQCICRDFIHNFIDMTVLFSFQLRFVIHLLMNSSYYKLANGHAILTVKLSSHRSHCLRL